MKISLNSIRAFNKFNGCADDVAKIGAEKLIEKIGAQLGAVEEVIDIGTKYDNIAIVRVVSCEPHPNADKLTVCKVDDGRFYRGVERDSKYLIQIVCGAPNVKPGMLAVWIPPGTVVPETADKQPFKIKALKIRGVTSNGMLASAKELALGDNHDGIFEVDIDTQPGVPFVEMYNLEGDIVLDIENKMFTHRPDCFGFLGVARELAGIQQMPYSSPKWYDFQPKFPKPTAALKLTVKNELPKLVPRFTAIAMSDVKVGPSPNWLQIELAKLGQKPINNIVDLTNFLMLETAQPLHAYDYDKVKALSGGDGAKIVVRSAHKNDKVKLLGGKTVQPRDGAVIIATDKQAIGLGGVMGGADTEVDEKTTSIIIECANFDMYETRRTSMAHGLFTDAATRFTKGQSPLQNLAVLANMVGVVQRIADGQVASQLIDNNHLDKAVISRQSLRAPVKVSASFINARLGEKLSAAQIRKLLENVEFKVTAKQEELTIKAPFWRTDIEIPEDIVEEVGRLYGYDHLPLELPQRDVTPTVKDPLLTAKAIIRQRLAAAGANEVLTYSFVHGDLLAKTGQDKAKAFQLSNALSPDLQYYRISLMPSLLEKVHPNIKAGYDEFALFELGKTHGLDNGLSEEGLPVEFEFTALVIAAADKLKKSGAAYYQARRQLENLAGVELEFKPMSKGMLEFPVTKPYDRNRMASVSLKESGEFLGIVGEFNAATRRSLKLPRHSAGFEIDTTALQKVLGAQQYQALPRFPKVSQDITLRVPAEHDYQAVYDCIEQVINQSKPKNSLSELQPRDIFQKADDSKHRHLTFRLDIASYERTLTDKEVNSLLDAAASEAKKKLHAERL